MKLTAILLLAAALQVSASGFGQRITLTLKNASLEKTITEIEKQSGFNFVYGKEQLAQAKTIDLTVSNEKLESVLDLVFKDQPLTYTISGKYIAIRQKVATPLPENSKQEASPPIDVSGRVVNDKGEPVEGALVTVKGTNKSVSTNANGEFTLPGVDGNATLVVSAVNIETYEIKVAGKTDLVINVKTKVTTGDVVTVEANTGYQKVKPNEITGSVVVINNEQLNRVVSTDILSKLQDVSGLLFIGGITNGTDQRNNIRIRSLATIFSNKQPLIVLDNFPYEGDINSINPNDVESVTILKDAAAASLWGARGGNGVIVITSKSGKYNQRYTASINSTITVSEKPDLFKAPVLGSSDFIDVETFLFNKGFYNTDIGALHKPPLTPVVEILLKRRNGQISPLDSANQLAELRMIDVRNDLLKYYYNKILRQQHSFSLTGGSANQHYYVSLGYDYNLNNSNDYSRYTMNASHTYSLMKRKMEISTGIMFSQINLNDFAPQYAFAYPYGKLADSFGNALPISLNRQEFIDTVGNGRLLDWTYYPLREKEYADNKTKSINYRINIGLKYKIWKGFDIDVKYQYGKQQSNITNHHTINSYYTRDLINLFTKLSYTSAPDTFRVPKGGILDLSNTEYISHNLRGQIGYNRTLGRSHQINAIGGAEIISSDINSLSYRYYGYNSDIGFSLPVDYSTTFPTLLSGNLKIPFTQGFNYTKDRYVSTFANAAYTYKQRYALSASIRRDGSNLFGTSTNNKWKPIWSVGASWDISQEKFYNSKTIPRVKLRATYGYQGNVNSNVSGLLTISYLSILDRWSLPTASIGNNPNPDLRWEKVGQLNLGVDFSMKNNSITGSIDYYQKKGTDIVGEKEIAPSNGVTVTMTNSANIKGRGLDIVINTNNLTGKFKWSTTFLFSYAKDWVSDYKLTPGVNSKYVGGSINPIIGSPVNALYSYRWAGLDPSTGDPLGYVGGQISKNYSSIINSIDYRNLVYHGPSVAPYFGSISNNISWKGISLFASIVYKFGYYFRRPSIKYNSLYTKFDRGNTDFLLRWQKPGDERFTNVPSMNYPGDNNRDAFYSFSEILVEKGDHIRLQNIGLSYELNRQKIGTVTFNKIKCFVTLSNIGIIWKANKRGIDPDFRLSNEYTNGREGRTFSGGLKIDF